MEVLRDALDCHVVGVEYPGYGLTSDLEANEQRWALFMSSMFL